jgi:Domain of unknown function (DUF4166)
LFSRVGRTNSQAPQQVGGLKTIQTAQAKALYPSLVGEQWAHLGEPVQRLHMTTGKLLGAGRFTVRHGDRAPARLLARLLGLPAAGTDVHVRLVVTPHEHGERWHRTFGASPIVSEQSAGKSGLMVERLGLTEVRYRLEVAGGALFYRQMATALRLGPIRLPLPRRLAPQIVARESAMPDEKGIHISVKVTLPVVGLLVSYKGYIELQE